MATATLQPTKQATKPVHGVKAYANHHWSKKYENPTPQQAHFLETMETYRTDIIGKWRKRKGRGSSIYGLKPTRRFARAADGKLHWHRLVDGQWVVEE